MEFERDEEKNKINKQKHHISFEVAARVFEDNDRIEMYDSLHSNLEEACFITIGKVKEILFVVYTERNEKTRLISARLAESDERRLYNNANSELHA